MNIHGRPQEKAAFLSVEQTISSSFSSETSSLPVPSVRISMIQAADYLLS